MSDESSSSSSMGMSALKALGGAALTVVTAVLIYHFTQNKPPAPVPVPAVVQPVEVDGFVDDASNHQLLHNASVTVRLGADSVQQFTDSSGRYAVVFPNPAQTIAMGSISTRADGYQSFENSVEMAAGKDNFASVDLVPVPAPGAAPGNVAVPLDHLHPIILRTPPPNYIKLPTAAFAKKQ